MKYNAINGNGIELSVQHFPDRKKPKLCVEHIGYSGLHVIATFNGEVSAAEFLKAVCKMTGTRWPEEEEGE